MVNSRAREWDTIIYKKVTQSITSDDTITADSELTHTLPVGTYIFMIKAILKAHATPDIDLTVTFSGTATGNWGLQGDYPNSRAFATEAPFGTDDTPELQILTGSLVVTGAGILAFAWAQTLSDSETTSVLKGSTLHIKRTA